MRILLYTMLFLPLLLFSGVGDVIETFDLPMDQPFGMTRKGDYLLIGDRGDGSVYQFSLKTKTLNSLQSLPCRHPWGLASDGTGIWIADRDNGRVFRYNLETGRVDRVLRDLETDPSGLVWDGETLWATSGSDCIRLDPQDGTELQTFEGPGRDTTGIDFDGQYLWMAERYDDRLVCSTTGGIIFCILPAPGPYPAGICRTGDRLWVLDFQQRRLYALDIGRHSNPAYTGERHRRKIHFTYSLTNRGPSDDVNAELFIALAKDGPSQKLLTPSSVFPKNHVIETDHWGQSFAVLRQSVPALTTVRLGYTVMAETWDLKYFILPEWVQGVDKIPTRIKDRYLVDGHKLDTDNREVKRLAAEILGGEKNSFWIAFKIHRYLHLNMEYKRTGGWNVAPTVLKRGNGSCSEFTFAFIALARAAGLPARYEAGLVVRGDDGSIDRVYHRWAQVYLPPLGWIPVDPSRGIPATAMDVAASFGSLSHRFLITTHSGGDSPYLGWTYNYHSRYDFSGSAVIDEQSEAKWYPADNADQ